VCKDKGKIRAAHDWWLEACMQNPLTHIRHWSSLPRMSDQCWSQLYNDRLQPHFRSKMQILFLLCCEDMQLHDSEFGFTCSCYGFKSGHEHIEAKIIIRVLWHGQALCYILLSATYNVQCFYSLYIAWGIKVHPFSFAEFKENILSLSTPSILTFIICQLVIVATWTGNAYLIRCIM